MLCMSPSSWYGLGHLRSTYRPLYRLKKKKKKKEQTKTPNIPKLKIPILIKSPQPHTENKENEPEEIQTPAMSTDLKDATFGCPAGVEAHWVGIYLVQLKHIPLPMCNVQPVICIIRDGFSILFKLKLIHLILISVKLMETELGICWAVFGAGVLGSVADGCSL